MYLIDIKIRRANHVILPNYRICDDLNKESLLKECLKDDELKSYIPDPSNLKCIEKDFFLSVNFYF